MSTCRAKRIRRSPGRCLRLIPLGLVAALFRPRTGETRCSAQRCLQVLFATETLLGLIFVAASSICVLAQIRSSQIQTEQSEKGAVKAAYEAYLRAWKDKDYTALNNLLSDDYQAVNFHGIVSTKANEITTAKEDRTYKTLRGHVISVAVFGDIAVASGLIEASWKDAQGNLQSSTFRFLAMLLREKGDWKLVGTQSTRFSKSSEPGKK